MNEHFDTEPIASRTDETAPLVEFVAAQKVLPFSEPPPPAAPAPVAEQAAASRPVLQWIAIVLAVILFDVGVFYAIVRWP